MNKKYKISIFLSRHVFTNFIHLLKSNVFLRIFWSKFITSFYCKCFIATFLSIKQCLLKVVIGLVIKQL